MDNDTKNNLNNINLTYLLNKQYNIKNKENKNEQILKKDKKFYKKRIIDISKKILNEDIEKNEKNNELIYLYDKFASKCIDHFKTIDKNDEIQDKLKNVSNQNNLKKTVVIEDEKYKSNEILFNNSLKKEGNLDKFVKKSKKEELFIPKQNDIDLYKKSNKVKNIKKRNKISVLYNENQKEERK